MSYLQPPVYWGYCRYDIIITCSYASRKKRLFDLCQALVDNSLTDKFLADRPLPPKGALALFQIAEADQLTVMGCNPVFEGLAGNGRQILVSDQSIVCK